MATSSVLCGSNLFWQCTLRKRESCAQRFKSFSDSCACASCWNANAPAQAARFHRAAAQREEDEQREDPRVAQLESQCASLQDELSEARTELLRYRSAYEDLASQTEEAAKTHASELQAKQAEFEHRISNAEKQQILHQSKSQMSALENKVDGLEAVIKHLNAQLEAAPGPDVCRSYERKIRSLQKTNEDLQTRLSKAEKHHTPTMRQFSQLELKITELEDNLRHREHELQRAMQNNEERLAIEIEAVNNKWQTLLHRKQTEINRFRVELDSILEVLRLLKERGVVVPASLSAAAARAEA
eukprot:m.166488 g.166488  ORF g.166488 m.166488 type:complete len:300 (+) comp10336_c1_seq3:3010-3909(+)